MDRLKQTRRAAGANITVQLATPEQSAPERPRHWIEGLSLVLSLVAIATAAMAYLDQRDVNALTEDRYERRYADRVSWWADPVIDKTGLRRETVTIQNRSLAPIRAPIVTIDVELPLDAERDDFLCCTVDWQRKVGFRGEIWAAKTHWSGGDIQPCRVVKFDVRHGGEVREIYDGDFFLRALDFRDGAGQWWRRTENAQLLNVDEQRDQLRAVTKSWFVSDEEKRTAEEKLAEFSSLTRMMDVQLPTWDLVPTSDEAAEDCTDS